MSYPPQPGYGAPGGYPPPGGGFAPPPANQSNGMAIAALVMGILSVAACLFPLGLVAVIVGFLALKKARELNGSGRGLAIGGIVTGAIGLITGVILLLTLVVFADDVNDDLDRINSDPSDGVCNTDRFLEDPDC